MKKTIHSTMAPEAVGPYSQAVLANGTLYVSGQIPLDPVTGNMIIGDIEEQTRRVMSNIKAILNAAEMDFSNVVKTSIFLSDMNNFGKVNGVYASYFSSTPPARETIQAACLPKNAEIEISVIAIA